MTRKNDQLKKVLTHQFEKRYRQLPQKIKADIRKAVSALVANLRSPPKNLKVETYTPTKLAKKYKVKKCKPHQDYRMAFCVRPKLKKLIFLYIDNRGQFYKRLDSKLLKNILKSVK